MQQLKFVKKEKNPLLSRQEIEFEIDGAKITPSKKELRQNISSLCDSKEEMVVISSMKQHYGSGKVTGSAFVYDSKEALERIENKYLINRQLGIKGRPKEEAKKEEAPKEEKGSKKEKKKE